MTIGRIGIDDPMTELLRQHEWVSAGCETVLGPRMLALVDWVDSKVVEFAIKAGASELPVSRLIDRSVLERAGYFESFPASIVEESDGGCIPPATCYHCYAKLAAKRGQRGIGSSSSIYHEGDCVRRVFRLGTGTAGGMDGSHICLRAIASA